VQIPLSRIEQLHFSQLRRQSPPKTASPARLMLANKDRLSIQLEQWSEGHLNAAHPLLGRLAIKTSALREMVFD
jgi:hypothetical protein